MDVLFERSIQTWVQENSCDKCRQNLNICISYNINTTGQRKDLSIRVTNPENAFMLYSLKLNEDDYHNLKSQQGLLIDFPSFPTKLIELLKTCENTEEKFELHLHTQLSTAVLQVVEVNPFKHLVHLALNLSTATDAVVKKYLADCLTDLQRKHKTLQEKCERETQQYNEKIQSLEEILIDLKSKLQGGERAKDLELSEQSAVLKEQMQKEREASQKYQHELNERAELTTKQLENRVQDLENKCKKIFDEKCRFELQNRELIAKVKLYEEERISDKGEIKRLKLERSETERENRKEMTEMHSIKTQLAVAHQELKDNHIAITNLQEQLSVSNAQKSKLENQIDTQHYQCIKLENTVRSVSEEVVKGNEIISKMQTELKNYRSKLKIKHMQNVQQEKTIKDKDEETRKQQQKLGSLETELEDKSNIIEKLEVCKEDVSHKLEECEKTLKSNENVIAWLNKQMNDKVTLGVGPRSLPSLLRNQGLQELRGHVTSAGSHVTGGGTVQELRSNTGAYTKRQHPSADHRYNKGALGTSSTPTLNNTATHHGTGRSEYHHLSSFDTSRSTKDDTSRGTKDDSLLDEMYLKDENAVEDTLQAINETTNSQVITLGRNRKILQQKQNSTTGSKSGSKSSVSFKRDIRSDDPPLMKVYAP